MDEAMKRFNKAMKSEGIGFAKRVSILESYQKIRYQSIIEDLDLNSCVFAIERTMYNAMYELVSDYKPDVSTSANTCVDQFRYGIDILTPFPGIVKTDA